MVGSVVDELGTIDTLVNNAAVMSRYLGKPRTPFWECTVQDWELVRRVNVIGPCLCSREVVPGDEAAGPGQNREYPLQIWPSGTDLPWPARMAPYTTSKAAVIGMTRALAGEAGDYGITVNAVAPGVVGTPTVAEHLGMERLEITSKPQAIKRLADPATSSGRSCSWPPRTVTTSPARPLWSTAA